MSKFDEVLKVVEEIYPNFDWGSYCKLLNISFLRTTVYANDNLLTVIDEPYLRYLQANLLIHFFITNPESPLYDEYKIEGQDFLVTSVSSAGASTSINTVKAMDEGDFLTLDLYRTRFGREAYQIMQSLKGVAII